MRKLFFILFLTISSTCIVFAMEKNEEKSNFSKEEKKLLEALKHKNALKIFFVKRFG